MQYLVAIHSLIQGINFKNSINNKSIAGLIDPTAIAALARTQLEAFANFHNIFNSTEDRTLTELLYNLWVVSGLNYRQKSVKEGMAEEHKLKAQREKLKIDVLIDEIHNNKYYTELSEPDQKWLNERIKKRDFELIFRDGKFLKPGWRELFLNSGVKTLFEDLYTIMSWSVHPSNISVFQYAEMFEKGYNINTAFTILDHSKFIMAFMISEYCKYFEVARQSFNELPLINRLMIESYNRQFRDPKYLISTVWDEYTPLFQSEYEKRIKQQG